MQGESKLEVSIEDLTLELNIPTKDRKYRTVGVRAGGGQQKNMANQIN